MTNKKTMEYQILKIDIAGSIAVVTISRPSSLNALNSDFFTEISHFLDDLEPREDVKVLVVTGEGKAFVAGADIGEMANMNEDEAFAFSSRGQRTLERLVHLRIPVIAAVNGYALGGGCELAMACDFRIASNLAKFGQPEMSLGLIPGYAGTQRLARLTGLGNALFMILTGETITAEEALRIGLVQKVTEPGSLMEEVMKIAAKIAGNGSQAVPVSKKVIHAGSGMVFGKASEMETTEFSKLFGHPASKEGMKAFLEKRKPDW
jgi:enoyl-CoA hydratase